MEQKFSTPKSKNWINPTAKGSPKIQTLMKNLTTFEKALIGSSTGGMAGAFTYVCLLPLDTIKTKLQTKGATQIYKGSVDVIVKTFQAKGILGFYRGICAVIVGSTVSSAIYFGTCEFGKLFLSKFSKYPSVLIPPTAGAMGNIVSSAVMVPKELITQRMQASVVGRSWQVLLSILQKDGILGLHAGYTATLLRNLPAGVLSYSSFEYLKAAVFAKTKKGHLEPFESVCCGALAGAIAMAFPLGGNNQLDTLIWYSWLGGIIIGTMIGSNMVLEEHYKAGPRIFFCTQLNNAGTNKGFRPLLQFADEDIEQIVSTNLVGSLLCTREDMRVMRSHEKGGHIFNMDSAGSRGSSTPLTAVYGSTKCGIRQLQASLLTDYKWWKITNLSLKDTYTQEELDVIGLEILRFIQHNGAFKPSAVSLLGFDPFQLRFGVWSHHFFDILDGTNRLLF